MRICDMEYVKVVYVYEKTALSTTDDMEKLPRMSVMLIILGSIQWAVMDTQHLVGQAGAGREKTGRRICDMEYVKVEKRMCSDIINDAVASAEFLGLNFNDIRTIEKAVLTI
ncbi:hypothetical protein T01_251 [Trichinella spiralis]|uniref:Uncharacterized protein n=1 Tax=Trichinella spiralis TaxID=6334 RepID=A0A0V1AZA5_TRISP|nr:hypothetical protein T01_251 [Trichinella spiralis]